MEIETEIFQEGRDENVSWEIVPSTYDREAVPMKPQQYSSPNETCKVTLSVDMPADTKPLKAPSIEEELQLQAAEREDISLLQV